MLVLTDNAIEAINQLAPGDGGLRVSSSEPHDSAGQRTLQVHVTEAPAPEDQVVDAGGAHVFIEPGASALLDDKVLDATVDGSSVRFAVSDQT
jgi:Fe-S cluster assembly iron-binding protein IscA